MKHFILMQESSCLLPVLKDWTKKFSSKNYSMDRYLDFSDRELFYIEENENTEFPAVILYPFFLVRENIKNIIEIYDSSIKFKEIVLLEKNKRAELYFMPILKKIYCLDDNSILSIDKSIIKKAIIDIGKTNDAPIFIVAEASTTYIVIRLDLAESILKRDMFGMDLLEIETTGELDIKYFRR